MLKNLYNLIGGALPPPSNIGRVGDTSMRHIVILDLQSVLTYGTNGNIVVRPEKEDFLDEIFSQIEYDISNYKYVCYYILSDELSIDQFIKLLEKNNQKTAAYLVKEMFSEDLPTKNYYIYHNYNDKKNKLTQLLNPYKNEIAGSNIQILMITRLYTNNLKKEIFDMKKFLYHKLKSQQPNKYIILPIDNPELKNYEGNMQDRVYTMKSLKELYDFPMYAQPFIMTEEHYKSMNRRLDENTHVDPTKRFFEDFAATWNKFAPIEKLNKSIETQLK